MLVAGVITFLGLRWLLKVSGPIDLRGGLLWSEAAVLLLPPPLIVFYCCEGG